MERKIEFRVFDYLDKKVLYGQDIPIIAEGLNESIRQFSGQTYELSQYTEVLDRNGKKIYDKDIVDVFTIKTVGEYNTELTNIGTGLVKYYAGEPCINFKNNIGEIESWRLHDQSIEIELVGNILKNNDLLL